MGNFSGDQTSLPSSSHALQPFQGACSALDFSRQLPLGTTSSPQGLGGGGDYGQLLWEIVSPSAQPCWE